MGRFKEAAAGGGSSGGGKKASNRFSAVGSGRPSASATPKKDDGGDKPFIADVIGAVTSAVGRPVMKALDVLDTPRAALVSTVQEVDDLTEGRGFSGSDWLEQTGRNMGVGEYIENSDTVDIDNLWAKRALGFVGDVALDPLSYATFGATATARAGGKAARMSAKDVADMAVRRGMDDAADRVLTKRTAAALTPAEKADLGIRTGIHMGVGNRKAVIPGTANVGLARAAVVNPVLDRWLATPLGGGIRDAFDTQKAFRKMRKTPGGSAKVAKAKEIIQVSSVEAEGFRRAADNGLNDVVKRHKKVDGPAVLQAIEVPGSAPTPAVAAAATDLSAWFEKVRSTANEAMRGRREIPAIDNYVPHQLADEYREVLFASGRPGAKGAREGFERQREARVGTKWFGVELVEGSIREMNEIAKAALGDNYKQIMRDDPWAIARSYAAGVSRMVERERGLAAFERAGLTQQFDLKSFQKAQRVAKGAPEKVKRLTGKADELDVKALDAEADAMALADSVPQAAPDDVAELRRMAEAEAIERLGVDARLRELARGAAAVDPAEPTIPAAVQRTIPAVPEAVAAPAAKAAGRPLKSRAAEVQTLQAQRAALEEELEAAVVAARTATRGAAQANRQSAAELATMRRIVQTPDADPSRVLAALGKATDPDLVDLRDEMAAAVEELRSGSGLTGKARRDAAKELRAEVASLQRAAVRRIRQLEGVDVDSIPKFNPAAGVDDASPLDAAEAAPAPVELAADPTAIQAQIDKVNAQIAKVAKAEEAAVDKRLANGVGLDEAAQPRKTRRQVQAEKVVVENQADIDQARVLHQAWAQTMADNATRRAELEGQAATLRGRSAALVQSELELRRQADDLAAEAAQQPDEALAEVAKLEALAAERTAKAVQKRQKAATIEAAAKSLPGREQQLNDMVAQGLMEMKSRPGTWADPATAELIEEVTRWNTPENVNRFWKAYDGVMSRWKAQALLSPGFHFRNTFGGMWNNAMADVDVAAYPKFFTAARQYRRGGLGAIKNAEVRGAFEAMERLPVYGGADVRDIADVAMGTGRDGLVAMGRRAAGGKPGKLAKKLDPTSLDFTPYTANRKVAENVEKTLRGPLFVDRILKGFTPEEALAAVHKYHFDYSDLAQWESTWGRRVVPFYTWTRKNLPLQLEGIIANPGLYTRYLHAKRNIELGTERDEYVPEYMERGMAIDTGATTSGKGFFGGSGEDSVYLMPDLPFIGLDEAFGVNTLLSSTTPLAKLPVEVLTNRSLFTGSEIEPFWAEPEEVPNAWKALGIPQALEQFDGKLGLPKVGRDENGDYVMGRKELYKIDQSLPILARLRRMAPSEQFMQDRAMTNYLSFLFGVGARTLTDDEQRREKDRRERG